MNYRRGFFRAWVLLSVLWIGAIATLAISATGPNSQNGVIYSYVYVMRPEIKPTTRLQRDRLMRFSRDPLRLLHHPHLLSWSAAIGMIGVVASLRVEQSQ